MALEIAADASALAHAKELLESRIHARSAKGPAAYRLRTWEEVARTAGHDPFALDPKMIYDVVAALWASGYRAIDSYISVARQQMILDHGSLPESIHLHFRRIARAAARGRGPAKQAHEIPFCDFQR